MQSNANQVPNQYHQKKMPASASVWTSFSHLVIMVSTHEDYTGQGFKTPNYYKIQIFHGRHDDSHSLISWTVKKKVLRQDWLDLYAGQMPQTLQQSRQETGQLQSSNSNFNNNKKVTSKPCCKVFILIIWSCQGNQTLSVKDTEFVRFLY